MEQEKIKDIKIALSSIQQLKFELEGQEIPFIVLVTSDCLDYINELENENEKLKQIGLNEDIEAEKSCNECINIRLNEFAKWLAKRSNNEIYLELVKEFTNEPI